MKVKILSSLALLFLITVVSSSVKSQTVNVSSVVPDSVDVWGPPLNVDMMGQPVVIRLKVVKHFGTTCVFNVEITNNGTRTMSATMGFLGNTGMLHEPTAGFISIKPGEGFYWKREKREVLKRGVKNDALVCKNCNPTLGFLGLKFR
ncbi:MAG: hypothetical protein H7Y13_10080 [Sphingobacteriaceae bacterium]|nr:hypothetical protein [Sphingobacteriaceae bacterium]